AAKKTSVRVMRGTTFLGPRAQGPASADPLAYSDGVCTVNAARVSQTTGRGRPASEHELDLHPDVVLVTDRAELAGRGPDHRGVVDDEAEGVAHELDAGLEDPGPLPVVEHAVRRDDSPARVRRRDEQRLQEAIVVQAVEPRLERAGVLAVLR